MTAHPIELIAGLDDGIDLDEKDQVTRHIAACDTCRTVARTMQRIDGLIALPEPMLALPARATPRRGMAAPRWASLATVVVTLAVVIGVTVGSLRQSQVSTATAADTCALLTTAAQSTGIGAASAKAAPIPGAALPSRLSESWKACGLPYGPDEALVLFRTRATYRWEINALLADVTSGDRTTSQLGQELTDWGQLFYGNLTPRAGDTSTDRWITSDGANPSNRQGMVVFADPYFFAVIAPLPDGAGRLADAIVAELRQRPWPLLSEASKLDACNVIRRVAPSAGLGAQDPLFPVTRHWAEIPSQNLGGIGMSNNVCAFRDESRGDQHLWIREEPTTLGHAGVLLAIVSSSLAPSSTVGDWTQIEAGMWLAHSQLTARDFPNCLACPIDYTVVAVFEAQRFFALTQATDDAAIRTARAVLAELKRP